MYKPSFDVILHSPGVALYYDMMGGDNLSLLHWTPKVSSIRGL
jgi:hypothetical protein